MEESELVPYAPVATLPPGPWLVFAPHPDDEVLGMGGTLALAARAGIHVEVVVLTGGERAGDAAIRRDEALAAGAVLGIARHHFWSLPDRGVAAAPFPTAELRRILAACAPRTLFLPAAQEYHPDHRATTRRLAAALTGAGTVWRYEITRQSEANRLVDISTVCDVKAAAIRCFASQLTQASYGALADGLNRARTFSLGPAVTHAEAFWEGPGQLHAAARYATPRPVAGGAPLLTDPRVTVIVRTHDRRQLLAQALTSIAAQSYPHVEAVVVNDGGGDVSDVVARFAGARLATLPERRGRAAAANRGLAETATPLVAFLDDDDLYLPGALAALVAALGTSVVVQGRVAMQHVDAGGAPVPGSLDRLFDRPFDRARMLVENHVPLNALLFRRELFDEVGRFREDLELLEDWELLLRLSDAHVPAFLDETVAIYRVFAGVGTAAGTRFSPEDMARTIAAIRRERWPEVTPEVVQAYALELVGAGQAARADQERQVAWLRPSPPPSPAPLAAPAPTATTLLLLCPEPLRAQQQGIGIRFREMAAELATALATGHRVILYAPNRRDLPPADGGYEIRTFDEGDLLAELPRAAAVIVQGLAGETYFAALERHGVTETPPLICDLYDPFLVENLCYTATLGPEVYRRDRAALLRQLARGDRFLVSSRTQSAFYVGLMMGHGQFIPGEDTERLFLIAPFGVRAAPPVEGRPAHHEYVLFFGGVYDWYDPHLLLDALPLILPHANVRVRFTRIPSPDTTPQKVFTSLTARVAADPTLAARVDFVPWFPHHERHQHLRDVDLAVSLHRPGLETDVSLRTRVLEYLACGLPVVATDGGESAAILRAAGGRLVPPGDAEALAAAILELLRDGPMRERVAVQGQAWVARHMSWTQTLAPLVAYCREPLRRRPLATVAPAPAAPAVAPVTSTASLAFSVVVPTYEGRAYLPDCLGSLEASRFPRQRFEILLVDNGSSDGTAELVRQRFPAVRVVALGRNTGFTGAIAAGAAAARGETLVFLNNDMRVDPGWLEAYDQAFAGGAVCAAGRILDWSGERIDFVGAILTFDGHALQRHQGSPAGPLADLPERPTFIACGGNMAVRRELFAELGGFDDAYFAYSEDVDFSWRLHAAGHTIRFLPRALAYHHGQGTSTKVLGVYGRGLRYEVNAYATLYKNIEAPYFDALLHAAWHTLIHRTVRILADHGTFGRDGSGAPGLRDQLRAMRHIGPRTLVGTTLRALGDRILDGVGPIGSLAHPHALTQLEALATILRNADRLHAERARTQARRTRPDAEIFRDFPLWVVATYPGDEELFASPAFRAMLPRDLPLLHAKVQDVHDGTAPLGDHPNL